MRQSYSGDVIIHVGKTGGSYLKRVLNMLGADPRQATMFPHTMTVPKALEKFPESRVVFAVREPLSLFVSGFNTRLRKGKPLYNAEWSDTEAISFRIFATPNALAEALDSEDQCMKACAEFAMHSIFHVNRSLKHYLGSAGYLEEVKSRIAFILDQKTLDDDIARYVTRLDLDAGKVSAISGTQSRHETPPGYQTELSPRARANLLAWYAEDIKIFEWCRANKSGVNAN